jgi:hypothetical protein
MAKGKVYVAVESGSANIDGEYYAFHAGVTRVREGHPLLQQFPNYFGEVDDHVDFEWETATAAPDEKRGATPPKR